MTPSRDLERLLDIMAALRAPLTGCSWDIVQTFATIVPFTIEEAYEVADAVERGDLEDLKDELGDLLLQVVFHSRIAEEQNAFSFGDVVEAITRKLIRRHPHVFGSTMDLSPDAVKEIWAAVKAEEKVLRSKRLGEAAPAILDDVPRALPALTRAEKLQAKASKVGFDWNDAALVLEKIREETDEVAEALRSGQQEAVADEIGDLLFTIVNLARHAGVDPEAALRGGNAKFARRFGHIERTLRTRGQDMKGAELAEMEDLWNDAKVLERTALRGL